MVELVNNLLAEGVISSIFYGWQKLMSTPDGEHYYLSGTIPDQFMQRGDKPVKGHSFQDEFVANLIFGYADHSDVIFLSENIKNDLAGVRQQLKKRSASIDCDYKITAIFKNEKTSYVDLIAQSYRLIKEFKQTDTYCEYLV